MAVSVDSIVKLGKLQKVLIVAVVVAVIFGAYWYLSHRHQVARIVQKESTLNDLIRERNIKRQTAQNLEKFKAELAQLNAQFTEALQKLPDKREIPKLLRSVSNLGNDAGLEVLIFKPDNEQPGEFYSKVPVSLSFVGSYHNMGMFFYQVGSLPRIVSIEDFNIKKGKDSGDGNLVSSCTATTYRFVEATSEKKGGKKGK
jgi:type IV pilus assembly protein PilO